VAVVDYVVDAVHLIANEAVKLLAPYRFDPSPDCGITATRAAAPRSASMTSPTRAAAMEFRAQRATPPERVLAEQLQQASDLVASLPQQFCGEAELQDPSCRPRIRWFPLRERRSVNSRRWGETLSNS
jgi:hypothetical protein